MQFTVSTSSLDLETCTPRNENPNLMLPFLVHQEVIQMEEKDKKDFRCDGFITQRACYISSYQISDLPE